MPKMEPDCKSMEVFREGIDLLINFWRQIRYLVEYQIGGPKSSLYVEPLCDGVFSCFMQSKSEDPLCLPSSKEALKIAVWRQILYSIVFPSLPAVEVEEVTKQLIIMYEECLQGNFTSVEVIKEAKACRQMREQVNKFDMDNPFVELYKISNRLSRRMMCKIAMETTAKKIIKKSSSKVNKFGMKTPKEARINRPRMQKQANLSKMGDSRVVQGDSMGVFKEGVDLYMENLWARHVCIGQRGGSNPSIVLQELADEIIFWFTQTIKPLSLAYIEWMLMNTLYSLPIAVDATNKAITKEVAKKLMVMHEECLQGNFSSVEKLREESLSSAKC